MTCLQLVYNLFTTCLWLVHDLFMTWSCLVYDLFITCYDLSMTCAWPVHDLFTTCLQLVHDLFINLFMTCLWLVYLGNKFLHPSPYPSCSSQCVVKLFCWINPKKSICLLKITKVTISNWMLYLRQNKEMQNTKCLSFNYYNPISLYSTVPEQWYDLLAVVL